MSNLITIVEDEEDILELIEYNLQKAGFETVGCINTKNVEKLLNEEDVSLIIMDRNLPNVEGAKFISSIRQKGFQVPIIFLTAKDKESDIIEGFEAGADDYITKPFSITELVARIKAVLKRTKSTNDLNLKVRDIVYNANSKEILIDGDKVSLTRLELSLLLEFMKNKNILLTREYLLDTVWEDSSDKKVKTVNVAIKRLKEKIDPDKTKEYIKPVRGEGYIFC
jgi:DNA-binding response OmpR family regulator